MDRRQFLSGATGALAAPLVTLPVAASAFTPVAPVVPLPPVWEVGIEGEMNWDLLRAPTMEAAQNMWLDEKGRCQGCVIGNCECYGTPDARRVKVLDKIFETTGDNRARQMAGWLGWCSRCGENECHDYHVFANDESVCSDCMTYGDWRQVDPKYADELLQEMLDDEYGVIDA